MANKIPTSVYLSTDRQWAKNPTPICTEEYRKAARIEDLEEELRMIRRRARLGCSFVGSYRCHPALACDDIIEKIDAILPEGARR